MSDNMAFMTERITEDYGEAFSPSRYSLKSKNDAIISPYKTYELFFEITFHVIQKLGAYEDLGTPEEIAKNLEELKRFRDNQGISLEEFGEALDELKKPDLSPHSEREIVVECLGLMDSLVEDFREYLAYVGIDESEEEFPFSTSKSYFEIVQRLLLIGTRHSGGTSTRAKCRELGFDPSERRVFGKEKEDE